MANVGTEAVSRFGVPAFATAFGLLMVGLAADGSRGFAVAAWMTALLAVGVGTVYRPAASLAVLLAVITIMLSNPPVVFVGERQQ